MSDGLQADPLEGFPYPPTHFDLYSLDQLQEEDRESERYVCTTAEGRPASQRQICSFTLFLPTSSCRVHEGTPKTFRR